MNRLPRHGLILRRVSLIAAIMVGAGHLCRLGAQSSGFNLYGQITVGGYDQYCQQTVPTLPWLSDIVIQFPGTTLGAFASTGGTVIGNASYTYNDLTATPRFSSTGAVVPGSCQFSTSPYEMTDTAVLSASAEGGTTLQFGFFGGTLLNVQITANGITGTTTINDSLGDSSIFTVTLSTSPGSDTNLAISPTQLASATVGQTYQTVQFQATNGTAPYSWAWSGDTPPGMQLSADGALTGSPTTAGSYIFSVTVTDATGLTQSESLTLVVSAATVSISPSQLSSATVGVAYPPVQFQASNGTGPYDWSWNGAIPGMQFTSGTFGGLLSGTPTAAGMYSFSVMALDQNGLRGSITLTLTVAGGAITISPTQLASATVGQSYQPVQFQASGGTPPYTWSWSGNTPPGLQFTGQLSGTPKTAGSYNFAVTVTDSTGLMKMINLTLTVAGGNLSISPTEIEPATVGQFYAVQFKVVNGSDFLLYTWSSSVNIPGMSFTNGTSGGVLSGTPTTAGGYSFSVTATDPTGLMASATLTLTVTGGTQPPTPPMTTLGPSGTTTNPTGSYAEPVNTATGNYYSTQTDLNVKGRGLNFVFNRFYNSLDTYSGPMGAGWNHSYNISLIVDPTTGIVNVKQPAGGTLAFAPGGSGFVAITPGCFDTLRTNADGSFVLTRKNQTIINFSASGTLQSVADRNANTQTMGYSSGGDLSTITDTVGRVFTLTYDGNHRVVSLTDPAGRTVTYAYDSNANLVSVTNPAGGKTTFSYDESHEMTSAVDPRGVTYVRNTFDANGRVVAQTNGVGHQTSFAYQTPISGTTTITDANGNAIQHVYDANLRLIQVIDGAGDVTSITYDENNDQIGVSDGAGNLTTLTYDGVGNALSVNAGIPPGGGAGFNDITSITYDATNDPTGITDPAGHQTLLTYNQNGNLASWQNALGGTGSASYDTAGEPLTATDEAGDQTQFTWDSSGDLTQVVDGAGRKSSMVYDSLGRLISFTDGLGHVTKTQYDSLDRVISQTDPLGNQTLYAYDAIGDLVTVTDADGNATSYSYDGASNLTAMTDALGQTTSYAYDGNNNRIKYTNARGKLTAYAYDAANRRISVTDPLGHVKSKKFDASSNVIATTDGNGNTNHFTYDSLNRLTEISYFDGGTVSESYDIDGNRVSMVDRNGTTSYAYDVLNQVTEITRFDGLVVGYGYDAVGRRTSLTYPDGHSLRYQYDGASNLTQVTDWKNLSTSYAYDAASNLTATTLANGVTETRSYDNANRLLSIVNSGLSGVVSSFAYTLDNAGNRLQVTDADGGVTKYVYDDLYRLTSSKAPSGEETQYSYDAAGNRNTIASEGGTVSYTYDDADEMLTAGSNSFTYDGNGSRLTKTTGGNTLSYSWDPADRLVSLTGGGVSIEYGYDGDGNRISQQANAGNYLYVNDSARALGVTINEQGPDGVFDYEYGRSLIAANTSSATDYVSVDGVGSAATVSSSVGAVKADYVYNPWGNLLNPLDPLGSREKYKFVGQALDGASGLYYMRARYYDPTVGRFLSRDVLGGAVGSPWDRNSYAYARNNPLLFSDPSGLSAEAPSDDDPTTAPPPCAHWICGGGVSVGNTAYGGTAVGGDSASAAATGSAGFGVFSGPQGVTAGGFAQVGGYAGNLAAFPSTDTPDTARGASINTGPSVFVTNATDVKQLRGPFSTQILTLLFFEIQFGSGKNQWNQTIWTVSVGSGVGLGYASVTTNTRTSGILQSP